MVSATPRPIPSIYQEQLAELRRDESDDVVSSVPTLYSCGSSLYRARSKILPALPKMRSGINLPEQYTSSATGDNFLIYSSPHNNIMVFATEENLRLLAEADTWYCDGTFDMCPKLFVQIYTIHAMVENKMFPLVYALLPDKQQTTYTELFTCVKERCDSPQTIFTDFECATQNAINIVFPTSTMKGCFFHYGQCLWRKAQKAGLQTEFHRGGDVRKLVKHAAALPLVPVDQVSDAWFAVLDEVELDNRSICAFTDYVTEQWVEGNHGVAVWNHHDTEGPRTTNHVEGWHSKLSSLFSAPHPNIFRLIQFFQTEQSYTEATILQIRANWKVRPSRKKYRSLNNRLQSLKDDLNTGRKNLMQYLDSVSHLTHL